jgi:hypothetical protein
VRLRQRVVCLAESARRKQVGAVAVAGKRPGLTHQPVNDVSVIDGVFVSAAQPWRGHLQLLRVPHLDRLNADAHLYPFPHQTRRHRIGIVLHADGGSLTYLHLVPHRTLQTPNRQRLELRQFFRQPLAPAGVPLLLENTQPGFVLRSAGEVPTATQQQRLLNGLLETMVRLLAIAVLMSAGGVGRLRLDAVVPQQSPVVLREVLCKAIPVHRECHAVGTMPPRYGCQVPKGVLHALAQTGKALRETHRHVLPVRICQNEVIQQMIEPLTLDGHTQVVHVREVRRAQPARLMYLAEEHFLGWSRQRTPTPDSSLQRSQHRVRILTRETLLQNFQKRSALKLRRLFQLRLQLRPYRLQRVRSRPPLTRLLATPGQLTAAPILPCRLAIHA